MRIKLPKIKLRLKPPFKKQPRYSLKQRVFLIARFLKTHPKVIIALGVWAIICLVFGFLILKDLPSPTKLNSHNYPVSTQIFDRNYTLLYEIYTDTNRTPVTLNSLPAHVTQATLSIEDGDFYHHFGFSFQGIIRALKNTILKNKLQGGSTITQQLVKTALLTPERTIKRKLREAVLTLATEILYSKNQILEMYLNHIPYGGTAYGIEAAAQKYFGKSAKNLSLSETSLLAGLPQSPTRYSPFSNPDQAKARQHEVLRRMVEDGYIDQNQADQAFQDTLHYAPPATDIRAPHFVFYIKNLIEEKYGLETVEKGGLRVVTTLDLTLQDYAQSSVSAEIKSLEKYRVGNGAALVIKPNTGEILSMIGSKDYFDSENDGQVNLTTRLRQPGSSIKPLNYVTALELGKLTPASILLDTPTCFKVPGQPPYCPKNYDGSFHGPVSLRHSLANSYNIPAVKTLAYNNLETFIATASAMGITTFVDPSRYGLSLTLGGGEVTMLDMATAFASIANQGVKVPLHPILKITDYTGKVYEEYNPSDTITTLAKFNSDESLLASDSGTMVDGLTRVLHRQPAYLISHILADNGARSYAFGSNSQLVIKKQTVSVKTGTTNDLKDNWTIGYTPDYLVAVWVGNNDSKPMNPYLVSGVTGAAPIWHDIISFILKDIPDHPQTMPPGIKNTSVCALSGTIPDASNPCGSRPEIYWDKYPPISGSPTKKNIWVDKTTGQPAFYGSSVGQTKAPENFDPNLLELREHTVISDPFVQDFCLDCPPVIPDPAKPDKTSYPVTTIDMATLSPDSYQRLSE